MSIVIDKDKIEKKQKDKLYKRLKLLDKIKEENYFVDFLTITFKDNVQYYEAQKDKTLTKIIKNLKKNYGVEAYFWVLEFQKRGVVHYHMLLIRNDNKKIGFLDKKKKYKHKIGFTNIKSVRGKIYGYMLKYINKEMKEERKTLYIEVPHRILKRNVRKKVRYRQYGFGGKIKELNEYKEIMKNYFSKQLERYGVKIKNKKIEYNNVRIEYKYASRYDREVGVIIDGVRIKKYRKRYKNLFSYEEEFEYEMYIDFSVYDYDMFIKFLLLELGINEEK